MMALKFGIITISDRSAQGLREDTSGPSLANAVEKKGWYVQKRLVIPDDFQKIHAVLSNWSDTGEVDIILTTGGTGFGIRDITPEATKSVIEREAPGLAEAMRMESLKITTHAMLSRAVCGIRKQTLIINLPGSEKASLENFEFVASVLPHAVQLLKNDPLAESNHRSGDKKEQ